MSVKLFGLSLISLIHFSLTIAQTQSPPQQVANIFPPSPQASALGKYGDLSIGMYTGTAQFSVPLYTLTTPGISVPITLNYSSNGIKVDELSSSVGMTWVLNAGGMITRTVYDKADFGTHTRATLPPSQNFATDASADANMATWMEGIAANGNDMQMDEFSYNFGGYNGKFFIDLNNQPRLMPYSPLKIEYDFSRTDWNFKITTPNGFKYYFGGNAATESGYSSGCSSAGQEPAIPNAWFLTKIEHPYDATQYVNFYYLRTSYYYHTGVSQTITFDDTAYSCSKGNSLLIENGYACVTCGPSPFIYLSNQNQFCTPTSYGSGLFLTEIKDSKYTDILFDTTGKPDDANGREFLVKKMTVINQDSHDTIKSFLFTYDNKSPSSSFTSAYSGSGTPRPFLSEVDERDSADHIIKPYKFEYIDNGNLAPRLSFAQDYFGFFNGVSGNTNFVPLVNQYPRLITMGVYPNRNPNYNFAAKGMLSKITYPTGGYTTIDYEGNTLDANYNPNATSSPVNIYSDGRTSISVTNGISTFTVNDTIQISLSGTLSCNCPNATGCPLIDDATQWAQLVQNGSTTVVYFTFQLYNQRGDCSKSYTATATLYPGTYAIGTLAHAPYNEALTLTVTSSGDFVYLPVTYSSLPSTSSLASAGGGVRVKKITSFDGISTSNNIVKQYEYAGLILPNSPVYSQELVRKEVFYGREVNGPACYPYQTFAKANYLQFCSNSLINLYGKGGNTAYYTKVTEILGDNTKNGGTEHYFSFSGFPSFSALIGEPLANAVVPNLGWQNGLDTLDVVFKFDANQNRIPVSKTHSTFSIDSRIHDTLYQYLIRQIGNPYVQGSSTASTSMRVQSFDVSKIPYISQWQYLSAQKNESFDLSGNLILTDSVSYFYDNQTHAQQTRVKSVTSKNDTITKYTLYPADYADNTGGIADLKNAYLHTVPIESVTTLKNTSNQISILNGGIALYKTGGSGLVTESKRIETSANIPLSSFKFSNQSSTGVLPFDHASSSFSADGTYKSAILFDGYDSYGNIIQQHKVSDVKHAYVWDYKNTFPIAEVVNATSSVIAYTSFEADGTGNWNVPSASRFTDRGFTGTQAYNLSNGNISTTTSTLGNGDTSLVSYWSDAGSYTVSGNISSAFITGKTISVNNHSWTFYQHKVTGVTSIIISPISGTQNGIDELRFYPSTAQMTTYTYEPLVGVVSKCDLNNIATYYEYDAFQRLMLIRDQDRNVIKRICYSYTGQTACAELSSTANITYYNSQTLSGFTVTYTNVSTGLQKSFVIPIGTGTGTLGALPLGVYNISISKPGNTTQTLFQVCDNLLSTGTSATFYNVSITGSSCNYVEVMNSDL